MVLVDSWRGFGMMGALSRSREGLAELGSREPMKKNRCPFRRAVRFQAHLPNAPEGAFR